MLVFFVPSQPETFHTTPPRIEIGFPTYALVVDDLDDSGEAARVRVVALNEDDAADLDQAPLGSLDGSVTHFDVDLVADVRMSRGRSECCYS